MTPHDPERRPDPALDALLADVCAAVDDDIAEDPGFRDLAAVVARAHRLDPAVVTADAVAEVEGWAPVVAIGTGRRRRQTRDDIALSAVLDDVRAQVEQDVMQRLAPPSTAPAPAANASTVSGRRIWSAVLAVAAVLVLVGGGALAGVLATRDDTALAPHEAVLQDPPTPSQPSEVRTPRASRRSESSGSPRVDEDGRGDDEVVDAVPEPPPALEAAPSEAPAGAPRGRRRRPASEASPPAPAVPSLEGVDAAAHAAWKAGDRAEAERLLRQIVDRAGKSRLADLAYGDLFTLARQAKAPAREVALWNEYLSAFPDGRFADDARAGLCRRAAAGDARRECWRAYLAESPDGAHRAQAQREVAGG